jgi:hypothetical protein
MRAINASPSVSDFSLYHSLKPSLINEASVCPEMVAWGSDQGRSFSETTGVAALRRGFPKGENADLEPKMPFPNVYSTFSSGYLAPFQAKTPPE